MDMGPSACLRPCILRDLQGPPISSGKLLEYRAFFVEILGKMLDDFVVFRNDSRQGSGRMSQRTDTRVPLMEASVGTVAMLSTPRGMEPAFAISDEDSDVLRGLLQALSQDLSLEDPLFLANLAQIGQLARGLCDKEAPGSLGPVLT